MKLEQSVPVVWKRDKTMSVVTQRNYKINYKTQKTMPQRLAALSFNTEAC